MTAEKPECMRIAKQYGYDYWDGDRKYGYGGYKYDGRWKPVAEAMVKHYHLRPSDSIVDIGCGKAHLLYEFSKYFGLPPERPPIKCFALSGFDISSYAIREGNILLKDGYSPWSLKECSITNLSTKNQYDFTYSINVFHNLGYKDLKQAIREMVRVTKGNSYICVESYRNEEELQNLQCWALTCQSFYSPDDWKEILTDNGYNGDVEFIYFS